jgi:hypothetical protein
VERHQFFIGCHHDFPGGCGFDYFPRNRGSTNQLGYDVDVGMIHHHPPFVVRSGEPSAAGALPLTLRLHTAATRNGKPSLRAI